ncbi:cytochrome P450 2J2-like protein [Lates japonicus]|uniref:Cytochrome P450 2J2-like protein n=1 Tax=Lates japonicus TaxID=270547 RepID=A0AAD3MAS0_LATJO|nr:cytochrome P450 2J2-like protein [Lates japonicus]
MREYDTVIREIWRCVQPENGPEVDGKVMKLMKWFDLTLQIEASLWAQLYNSFPLMMRCLPGPHQTFLQILKDLKDFTREELKKAQTELGCLRPKRLHRLLPG